MTARDWCTFTRLAWAHDKGGAFAMALAFVAVWLCLEILP